MPRLKVERCSKKDGHKKLHLEAKLREAERAEKDGDGIGGLPDVDLLPE